jgi:putative tryptophan/tyrosine transport system substrate-binding protein
MNGRRKLVVALGMSALALPLPLLAQKPESRIWRLGLLLPTAPPDPLFDALREGLRELGYVEGRNIVFETRWAQGKADRLDPLAVELVAANADLIVTLSTPAALAARRATTTIPIVFTNVGDPVGTGVVSDLAHPGGNATGLSTQAPELDAKRLELLHEILPGMSRLAMLWNDSNPSMVLGARLAEAEGSKLGLSIQSVGVHDIDDFTPTFETIRGGHASALLTLADPFTRVNRSSIVDFAARSRLPSIYGAREFVESGGLISYGPDLIAMQRRAAVFIDRIFKGAKPGDLPVEQPTVFELVINMKTANALGIKIPNSILARADRVIE